MGFGFDLGAVVGGIGSSLVSGLFNKHEANKNRDWQEDMSNTAIRRRVEDLKAAGLNPLLAVSSASAGASTPSGSVATIDTSGINSGISNAIQAYNQSKLTNADVALKQSEADLNYDKMVTNEIDRLNTQMDTQLKAVGLDTERFKQDLLSAQSANERQKMLTEISNRKNIDEDTRRKIVDTANAIFELEAKKKDPLYTEKGMKQRYYKTVAPSNPYEAGYLTLANSRDLAQEFGEGYKDVYYNPTTTSRAGYVPRYKQRLNYGVRR